MKRPPVPPSVPDPEARLTALLLGELSSEEAAALRAELAADPELRALHDRLAETIGRLRESFAAEAAEAPARLAPAKRRVLRRAFRKPRRRAALDRLKFPWWPRFSWRQAVVPLGMAAALALSVGLVWWKFQPRGYLVRLRAAPESAPRKAGRLPTGSDLAASSNVRETPLPELAKQTETAAKEIRLGLAQEQPEGGDMGFGGGGNAPGAAPVVRPPTASASPRTGPGGGDRLMMERYGLPPIEPPPPAAAKPVRRLGENLKRRSAGAAAPEEELAPLPLKLPVPAFMGTPTDLALRVRPAKPVGVVGSRRKAVPGSAASASGQIHQAADKKSVTALGRPLVERENRAARADSAGLSATRNGLPEHSQLGLARNKAMDESWKFAGEGAMLSSVRNSSRAAAESASETQRPARVTDEVFPGSVSPARAEAKAARLPETQTRAAATAAPEPAFAPRPEIRTADQPCSTFSLNVTDVSFELARAALERGQLPDPRQIRSEEFVNAFDYHDPEPPPGQRVGLVWERARFPFAHHREVIRFSLKTAAEGRAAGRPLNLVLLLDSSGSMERADRVAIARAALAVLGRELRPQDRLSVVTFAARPRLLADGASGAAAREALRRATEVPPEGGTNLEAAMKVAYEVAESHFLPGGINRVVVLTDGAANLGDVSPARLRAMVERYRRKGIAFDAFGVGWEGYNDPLLETLTRHGDGRYGFLNDPEAAATRFAQQLAGALRVAAADVKVQVEFNPGRVLRYRQVGYRRHRLTKEQFRDNTVDAAEIGAAEAGNALYIIEPRERGRGPLGYLRVRYRIPGTERYEEREWLLDAAGPAPELREAPPALRLATAAAVFAEWLAESPYARRVNLTELLQLAQGAAREYPREARPRQLAAMIQSARALKGL